MTYRVELSMRALRDLDVLYFQKNVAGSAAAASWFCRLQDAIESLAEFPERCPLAPENVGSHRELRNLLYGSKPHVYRILFQVDESTGAVKVLHIRHGAMQPLNEPMSG